MEAGLAAPASADVFELLYSLYVFLYTRRPLPSTLTCLLLDNYTCVEVEKKGSLIRQMFQLRDITTDAEP